MRRASNECEREKGRGYWETVAPHPSAALSSMLVPYNSSSSSSRAVVVCPSCPLPVEAAAAAVILLLNDIHTFASFIDGIGKTSAHTHTQTATAIKWNEQTLELATHAHIQTHSNPSIAIYTFTHISSYYLYPSICLSIYPPFGHYQCGYKPH